MTKYSLPVAIGLLLALFWISPDTQEIAAGVAIFLFGMLMLEDGFKRLGGGMLERVLAGATASVPRSMLFGFVSTTLLQSSSLVSLITISVLSAGMVTLMGAVGIVFGANIGTTTGAWLVAGPGLKVDIAAYAMPMIALSIILVFQTSKVWRGAGYALGGLGFLFLGIHHMKEGFEAYKDQIDLLRFALPGLRGLVVYTALGMVATVIMQSSHATMVLILTALAAGQITYENALALAIGSNIGTTITALVGSLGADVQGRRLALAHLVFNITTAAAALAFLVPLREAVDWVSANVGIGTDDHALKLALFHTLFNVLGVALMLPFMRGLVRVLERRVTAPAPDVSRPKFLNESVDAFPETLQSALHKEVGHLRENATKLILHGLNLHRHEIFAADSIADTVRKSRTASDLDIQKDYERRVKTLHSAIVEFATRADDKRLPPRIAQRINDLRDVAGDIVQAVKSIKHLRRNVLNYTLRDQGAVTGLYDGLRTEIARILVEIRTLDQADPEDRSALSLDQEEAEIEQDARNSARRIDGLIRSGALAPEAATSFLNDSAYAYGAMRLLIRAARCYYLDRGSATGEVEQLLALDDDEIDTGSGA